MMKNLALVLFSASAWAQVGTPPAPRTVSTEVAKPAPVAGSTARAVPKVTITRQTFKALEDAFNIKLSGFNPNDAVDMLGSTRGTYLQGFGAIFTAEIDLVPTPRPTPFEQVIPPAKIDSIHQRKLKQLPLLRQAMVDQMAACAKSFIALPSTDQLVVVVRLDYYPWEKTIGLPSQILLRADIKSAAAGQIQVEEQ